MNAWLAHETIFKLRNTKSEHRGSRWQNLKFVVLNFVDASFIVSIRVSWIFDGIDHPSSSYPSSTSRR